jgi:hypothetical protein
VLKCENPSAAAIIAVIVKTTNVGAPRRSVSRQATLVPAMTDGGAANGWTELTIDQLLDLVLLQGNRFIRELLRSKELPLGTNKEQFEAHLREAIADGRLTPADVQEWLGDVEGWGNQHVFVFDVPDRTADSVRQREAFVERLTASGLEGLLDAEIPLDPGEELALATIRHAEAGISFLWVRGSAALIRRKDLDYDDEIQGDEIEYHAYERRWSRVAARFEWRFESNLAAVLIARREERDYAQQRDMVLEVVDSAIGAERVGWSALDIARVITQLDSAGLDAAEAGAEQAVRVNFTVFQGAAASVRLAAASQAGSYQEDAAVREVRRAVNPGQFVGGSGDCYLTPTVEPEARRELHLRLYGREQRVLLWGKMTAEEVWAVVFDLRTHATA